MKFFGSRLSLRLTQLINESNHHKVVNDKNQVNRGFDNSFSNYRIPIKTFETKQVKSSSP